MKRKAFYLLVFVCFSVLISSAKRMDSDCIRAVKCPGAAALEKKNREKISEKTASSDFLFPFNSVFSTY